MATGDRTRFLVVRAWVPSPDEQVASPARGGITAPGAARAALGPPTAQVSEKKNRTAQMAIGLTFVVSAVKTGCLEAVA